MSALFIAGSAGFLLFLGVLAWLSRGAFRALQETGGFGAAVGGIFLAFAMIGLAGLGAVGCAAGTVAVAAHHVVTEGPVRAVQLDRDPWPPEHGYASGEERLRLRLKVRGEGEYRPLRRWLERETHGEVELRTSTLRDGGETFTLLEFGLPLDETDLADFERELEREFPGVALPDGLRLDLDAR